MIGLEGHRPDLTDYHECIKVIEEHVKQYTVDELEEMNWRIKQAGGYFHSSCGNQHILPCSPMST